MHGSNEEIAGPGFRSAPTAAVSFISGTVASTIAATLVSSIPLYLGGVSLVPSTLEMVFVHAAPFSALLVALLMASPRKVDGSGTAVSGGALGAAVASMIVMAYVALGVISSMLSHPQDMLLLLSPVVGGYFGGVAATNAMKARFLAPVVVRGTADHP
jgi:hypothetical protein